nr:MAG TPA: hypothetical protein [Caudoviricetes sp.]
MIDSDISYHNLLSHMFAHCVIYNLQLMLTI